MNPEDDIIERAARLGRTSGLDEKTGFGNLLQFLRDLARELARARRTRHIFDVVVFEVGSEMDPAQVAARIRPFLREEDAVARIGGQRYAVVVSDSESGDGRRAVKLLQEGLKSVSPFALGRRVVQPQDHIATTPLRVLQDATAALQSAREHGGDCIVTWQGIAGSVN